MRVMLSFCPGCNRLRNFEENIRIKVFIRGPNKNVYSDMLIFLKISGRVAALADNLPLLIIMVGK